MTTEALPRLRLSANQRFLETESGAPFFWLGDTAWELFHKLSQEETELYLENRRQKGFNVIQAVALAEFDGLKQPNHYGRLPLADEDPTRPDITPNEYDYWQHLDFVFERALKKGLYIGFLPTWGDKVIVQWGGGPVIFNPENARIYGRFLGEHYGRFNPIWILGGDRAARTEDQDVTAVWRSMASGIIEGAGHQPLMTYHPHGGLSSSKFWSSEESWLSFHMIQSGHSQPDYPNWEMIAADYERHPVKPVLDGEPNYEDHPFGFKVGNPRATDHDVRKQAYRAVFAGAFGHTYGHHSIWRMYKPGDGSLNYWDRYWTEALDQPGAAQLTYLRRLVESRPFFSRVPDQHLLASGEGEGARHIQAARCHNGSYAFIYIPNAGQSTTISMERLASKSVRAWWYDPRTGSVLMIGEYAAAGTRTFTPPLDGADAVLVLDAAESDYGPPGG